MASVPSPDPEVKRLIATLDALQAELNAAEGGRRAADAQAAADGERAAAAQSALHAALRAAERLDDSEQAVQAALSARLEAAAQREEQLRCARGGG